MPLYLHVGPLTSLQVYRYPQAMLISCRDSIALLLVFLVKCQSLNCRVPATTKYLNRAKPYLINIRLLQTTPVRTQKHVPEPGQLQISHCKRSINSSLLYQSLGSVYKNCVFNCKEKTLIRHIDSLLSECKPELRQLTYRS